ncbi:NAD(P)-dependent oxidoreductase [Candidatus Shapirobacteria bacterium CG09_land_8_20_14_0_10_49_15]|uniref:NAD(P)-dependent oxidoreductase n=2 Tax=Candidatus Shapironibacteriota TaxID=1752721 RepID=A0A2M8L728_9BACT|nr:MAG: NAD(P)-dependent oxidoreductase [Candidatus Shapirobacteria bacterium CG09_land_8_20_14_0_10_49_15]PJE70050.1 MAG: NAD(P)-dependent oxidoreductase [Candidatus Shapirobacteria bacterium CG10_big_fil_rev_8_21_14_0_10_48_15]
MKKRILVTGGCGFIGSEVVQQLLNKGYFVRVADNLSKPESSVKKGYEFIKADLTVSSAANKAFKGIDICINMAAKIGGIGYFHKYPATILSENNKIYSATFEAAARNKINRIIYISSSMVFESTNKFPSKETDIGKIPPPASAYGFSKLIGEWYCQAFQKEFGLNYSICRPFNAYGINEAPGKEVGYAHVIPDLTKKMLSGQYPIELLGDGQQTRCFTHVRDLANGIIAVMESKKAINQDFNISNPEETVILDLAKIIWKLIGKKQAFRAKFVPSFTHDVKRRVPNPGKMKRLLNWEAKIRLEKGLPEVINWIKKKLQ